MTVKQAVIEIIIAYYPRVKNIKIERAHPEHPMSGLQRLRELRSKHGIQYRFDNKTNEYIFESPLKDIKALQIPPPAPPPKSPESAREKHPAAGPRSMKVYRFIHFVKVAQNSRTSVWSCRNNRSGDELGIIKPHPAWPQYCFFPTVQAVYSSGCLNDIKDFIESQRI